MDEPLNVKVKRGRPKANAPALIRQPNELQQNQEIGIEYSEEIQMPSTNTKAASKKFLKSKHQKSKQHQKKSKRHLHQIQHLINFVYYKPNRTMVLKEQMNQYNN